MNHRSSLLNFRMLPVSLLLILAGCTTGDIAARRATEISASSLQVMRSPAQQANDDFRIEVSMDGRTWEAVPGFDVIVDRHNPRHASFAAFDFSGEVQVRLRPRVSEIQNCVIRPLARGIVPQMTNGWVTFTLDAPAKLSVEINGNRSHNLHLFASRPEKNVPAEGDVGVIYFGPGLHTADNHPHLRRTTTKEGTYGECVIPSDTTVYLHRDAVVQASLVVSDARNVILRGRGVIDATPWMVPSGARKSGDGAVSFPGIMVRRSKGVTIDGLVIKSPVGYLVLGGASSDVRIKNLKAFNHHLWGDGIDFMACSDIHIDDVFIRASDDCIAIYGSRWGFAGDSRNWLVENSILWADKAHAIHIGTHGSQNPEKRETLGDLVFRNIDILEHDERSREYYGAMSVNAGDELIVRDVRFDGIRVESIPSGELFNVRVIHNSFNPVPGHRVENIVFKDITYSGSTPVGSTVRGLDEQRVVKGVTFININYQGTIARTAADFNLQQGAFVQDISVRSEQPFQPRPAAR